MNDNDKFWKRVYKSGGTKVTTKPKNSLVKNNIIKEDGGIKNGKRKKIFTHNG